MIKRMIYIAMCTFLLSSCHIYRNYQRPDDLPTDSLYREPTNSNDTTSLGDLP